MAEIKIGFLPLYLDFYRQCVAEYTPQMEQFAGQIGQTLQQWGYRVIESPVAAVEAEVAQALEIFNRQQVDVIITLHLAYSPSLEAVNPLLDCSRPLILLDTTPDSSYHSDHRGLMSNHGIHGVQDLASVLYRHQRPFEVVAGYYGDSQFRIDVGRAIQAAVVAGAFKRSRVGRIGRTFAGMGDFQLSDEQLQKHGITPIDYTPLPAVNSMRPSAMAETTNWPCSVDHLSPDVVAGAVTACTQINDFIAAQQLTAFTFNFQQVTEFGLAGMPFMAASLAMANGIGYAGEGDLLTAAWVGAWMGTDYPVTFTEMFCPDWRCNRIYLSHMGEINWKLLAEPFGCRADVNPFVDTVTPVTLYGNLRHGRAMICNLAPGRDGSLRIIVVPGMVIDGGDHDETRIGGYFQPDLPVAAALRDFSRHGGTHHSALIYDVPIEVVEQIARHMQCECIVIE